MNRIDQRFARLRAEGKKALMTFITAGDPSLETTRDLILELERSGADFIQLGVPFSDPIAEGPVVQEANIRALNGGATLDKIMDAVREVREDTDIPLIYLMYYNSLLHYGAERFFAQCAEIGIDGVIIPDLPYEESGEIAEYTEKYGIYQIFMIAPNSDTDMERVNAICKEAKGFLYCVSSRGVTGARSEFHTDFAAMHRDIARFTDLPQCIGFGISEPAQAHALRDYCDGIIVGSAIVQQIAQGETVGEKLRMAGSLARSLKTALEAE